jgi:hypothetical protein
MTKFGRLKPRGRDPDQTPKEGIPGPYLVRPSLRVIFEEGGAKEIQRGSREPHLPRAREEHRGSPRRRERGGPGEVVGSPQRRERGGQGEEGGRSLSVDWLVPLAPEKVVGELERILKEVCFALLPSFPSLPPSFPPFLLPSLPPDNLSSFPN